MYLYFSVTGVFVIVFHRCICTKPGQISKHLYFSFAIALVFVSLVHTYNCICIFSEHGCLYLLVTQSGHQHQYHDVHDDDAQGVGGGHDRLCNDQLDRLC